MPAGMFDGVDFAAVTTTAGTSFGALFPYFKFAAGILIGLRMIRLVQQIRGAARARKAHQYDSRDSS